MNKWNKEDENEIIKPKKQKMMNGKEGKVKKAEKIKG